METPVDIFYKLIAVAIFLSTQINIHIVWDMKSKLSKGKKITLFLSMILDCLVLGILIKYFFTGGIWYVLSRYKRA